MKKWIVVILIVCIAVLVYVLGPRFDEPVFNDKLPAIHLNVQNVVNYVDSIESLKKLKPDNQARIIWNNDPIHHKTKYVVLYLPGFGASWFEGYPTNPSFTQYSH